MDSIASLPTSQDRPLTLSDRAILQSLQPSSSLSMRHYLLPTLVFFILSLPAVDTLIQTNITESFWMKLAIKAFIFFILLVLIQRF